MALPGRLQYINPDEEDPYAQEQPALDEQQRASDPNQGAETQDSGTETQMPTSTYQPDQLDQQMYAMSDEQATAPPTATGANASPYSEPSRTAPGTPYGSQPGSQDTGIANPSPYTAPSYASPTAGSFDPSRIRDIGFAESGEDYIKYLKSQGAPDSYIQQQFPGWNPSGTTTSAPTSTTTSQTGAVPAGFDATKWNDPNKKDPKYDAGHMLAAGKSLEEIGAYLQSTYPGWKYLGGDKMQSPEGDVFDFSFGSKAGINRPMWEMTGGSSGGQSTSGSITGAAGGGADYSGALGGGLSGAFGGGQLGDALARLLARGEAGANPRNPNIAGPTAAYRAAVERQGRRSRNAMAERMAAEGLNPGGAGSGAFDSAVQSEQESEGQNVANYQGKLITDEIAAERQDVVNALQLAQGQERLWLQQYLAILNDKLQRAQMSQQNQQYYDDLTYRMGRDSAGLDQQMFSYLQ